MNPYLPYPDLAQLRAHDTFEEAMEAYALYARDKGYPYLVAWKPWLHFASKLGRYYSLEDGEEVEPRGDQSAHFHFSKRMSMLRNRIIPEVFGLQGLDFVGAALREFGQKLRAAHQSGMLEDFEPPVMFVEAEQDDYELYDPAAVDIPVAEDEEYEEEAESSQPFSESGSEPDEQPLDDVDSQGDPDTVKESSVRGDTPTGTSTRDEGLFRQAAGAYSAKIGRAHV